MEIIEKKTLTVETIVKSPIEKVWVSWTMPEHITQWCHASSDWHAPAAENNLIIGGKFKTTMAAKDESSSFDFEGVYTNIVDHKIIEYTINDGRKVKIEFSKQGNETKVIEIFEIEGIHSSEMQREGWQAILDSFKQYTEAL